MKQWFTARILIVTLVTTSSLLYPEKSLAQKSTIKVACAYILAGLVIAYQPDHVGDGGFYQFYQVDTYMRQILQRYFLKIYGFPRPGEELEVLGLIETAEGTQVQTRLDSEILTFQAPSLGELKQYGLSFETTTH